MLVLLHQVRLYSPPPDNPYVGVAGLDEIFAIGLRNPWRWSFDRANGNMWIGDVGQGAWEEVNFRTPANAKGVNFGWHCYEGMHVYPYVSCTNDSINPIFDYPHSSSTGGYCITGGYVYRGSEYSNLNGWYICADYISGNMFKIRPNPSGGWYTFMQAQSPSSGPNLPIHISTFGEAEDGTLYAASLDGVVYKMDLIAFSPLPVRLISFEAHNGNNAVQLSWKTEFEENLSHFEIEFSNDGIVFEHAGIVNAANVTTGREYSFSHTPVYSGRIYYRLKMFNADGSFEYSNVISVILNKTNDTFVKPSLITSGIMTIYLENRFTTFELMNMDGAVVLKQNITGRTGRMDIPISFVPPGNYIARLRNNELTLRQKVIIR